MTDTLAGRHALVTGASRGIGLAIAQALVRAGARVALVARGEAALEARVAELGSSAVAVVADVSTPKGIDRAVTEVKEAFGDVPDLLVNNAGIFIPRSIESLTAEDFERTVRVNLITPFLLVRAMLPRWRELGRGHAITIGSTADRTIYPDNGAYSASKFGARALHEVLRTETRGTGIRATLIAPSATDTPIWDSIDLPPGNRFPPRDKMLATTMVADAVVWAAARPNEVNVDELRLSAT